MISSGIIALGLLGGNASFNMTQCKPFNSTNVSFKIVDHVCIFEWCESACHTSGKRTLSKILYNNVFFT